MRCWAKAGLLGWLFTARQYLHLIDKDAEFLGLNSTSAEAHWDGAGLKKMGRRASANRVADGTRISSWSQQASAGNDFWLGRRTGSRHAQGCALLESRDKPVKKVPTVMDRTYEGDRTADSSATSE